MHRVLVLGSGKIGSLIACLLSQRGTYEVHLGDITLESPEQLVEDLGLERVTPCLLDVRHHTGHRRVVGEHGPGPLRCTHISML